VRLPQFIWRPLRSLVLLLVKTLLPIIKFLVRLTIVKPYSLFLRNQKYITTLIKEVGPLQLLRQHQSVLYLVIAGSLLITINSVKIRNVVTEDFGQRNLLFPLIVDQFSNADSGTINNNLPPPLPEDAPIITESDNAIIKPRLVATQPSLADRDRIEYYQVQSGDTILGIAQKFNLNITTILWENNLTARGLIRIGQKLAILPIDGVSYKIKRGDTITKIAQRYRVEAEKITNFNQTTSLTPGQTIIIPGGRPPAAPTPTPTPPAQVATPSKPTTAAVRSSSKLQWPTVHRHLTQYYTWRHTGVDIAGAIGTPIYAAEDGVVETAGWNKGGYGYYIIIDHDNGLKTLYGHNSKLLVSAGERVIRGQQIANIGSTGRSTGPHLHFEVRLNGKRVNPLNYTK
jgi:murein DD-endopeptidase MepM/ murein hydrolase activator NlpD